MTKHTGHDDMVDAFNTIEDWAGIITTQNNSPLQHVLQGELNGCIRAIKSAKERPCHDPVRPIIIQRRTQRIKELKAEAMLLGIQLKD